MNLSIHQAECYTKPERYRQTARRAMISLLLSGLEYMHIGEPEKAPLCTLGKEHKQYLSLLPPGLEIDFQFRYGRENWVIQCDLPELSYQSGETVAELPYHGVRFQIPLWQEIGYERAMALRPVFAEIRELSRSGLPRDLFRGEMLSAALLSEFMCPPELPATRPGAAELLKQSLDADTGFARTLAQHCRQQGYSAGHLRKLFQRQYLLDPAEYRTRLRLGRVLHLAAHTLLTPKEIADAVGMKHVTHLNKLLRERADTTPGELLKRYRIA